MSSQQTIETCKNDFWEVAALFGECPQTVTEKVGFVVGLLSVFLWVIALSPQIVENYQKKTTANLALTSWLLWMAGDILNVAASFINEPWVVSEIGCAFVYSLATVTVLLQTLYYSKCYAGSVSAVIDDMRGLMTPRAPYYSGTCESSAFRYHKRTHSPIVWETQDRHSPHKRLGFFSPMARRPRRWSEPDTQLPAPVQQVRTIPFPRGGRSLLRRHRDPNKPVASSYTHDGPVTNSPGLLQKMVAGVGTGLVTVACIAVSADHRDSARRVLAEVEPLGLTQHQWTLALSWTMTGIYALSRLPQMIKMCRTGQTEGVSKCMFVLTMFANLTFFASILLKSPDPEYIMKNLPWLVDAGLCVLLDILILVVHHYLSRKDGARTWDESNTLSLLIDEYGTPETYMNSPHVPLSPPSGPGLERLDDLNLVSVT